MEDNGPTFGYDFNSDPKKSGSRAPARGRHVCPQNWKKTHTCPEPDQKPVWRNDGEWLHTSTESGSMVLSHRRTAGQVVELSKLQYTCDEFPPKTWVEGGDGIDRTTPAETRCAGFRCGSGKSEQNWQGNSHQVLRGTLDAIAEERRSEFPHFDNANSVIFFKFITTNLSNGIAAQVMSYSDKAANVLMEMKPITQAKRDGHSNGLPDWQSGVLYDRLMALAEAGYGNQIAIPVNDSQANVEPLMPGGMYPTAAMGMVPRWDLDDSDYRHVSPAPRTRSSTPVGPVAPLVKRATSTALEMARRIVQKAIAESAERNEARYKSPQRNKYRLRPVPSLDRQLLSAAVAIISGSGRTLTRLHLYRSWRSPTRLPMQQRSWPKQMPWLLQESFRI